MSEWTTRKNTWASKSFLVFINTNIGLLIPWLKTKINLKFWKRDLNISWHIFVRGPRMNDTRTHQIYADNASNEM